MKKFSRYLLNLLLIWGAVLLYKTNGYYLNSFNSLTQQIILFLAILYTITGFFFAFYSKKENKNEVLFMIVKIFFLPIMINFTINNFNSLKVQSGGLTLSALFTIESFNSVIFPFLLTLIFLIDTLWFAFGYLFEARFLNNKVRSVEPTLLGWIVAMICYPPFNSMFIKFTDWYANDYVLFSSTILTFIMRIIIIILLGVYVGATLSLGTKCSNLTNRGIVSKGPYAVIRHPAYISKNLAWWMTIIPIFSWMAFFSMLIWSLIYHLRTITEENHLMRDKDYREYCKKVKYRYIPKIY